jgi:Immunity protein 50
MISEVAMAWLDCVDRAEMIREIFDRVEPRLDEIRLHEVTLHHDGPSVSLRFDLSEFPVVPPTKWVEAGYDTVQLRLALDDVSEIAIEGWSNDNRGKMDIQRHSPTSLSVEFQSRRSKLRVVCHFARIDRISAYLDGD